MENAFKPLKSALRAAFGGRSTVATNEDVRAFGREVVDETLVPSAQEKPAAGPSTDSSFDIDDAIECFFDREGKDLDEYLEEGEERPPCAGCGRPFADDDSVYYQGAEYPDPMCMDCVKPIAEECLKEAREEVELADVEAGEMCFRGFDMDEEDVLRSKLKELHEEESPFDAVLSGVIYQRVGELEDE